MTGQIEGTTDDALIRTGSQRDTHKALWLAGPRATLKELL